VEGWSGRFHFVKVSQPLPQPTETMATRLAVVLAAAAAVVVVVCR
jgi:hypothetical protein